MPVLVAVLGAVIGVSLGALGGGGSVLTVPALVYALGEPVGRATTASLVIVGITSLAGAVGHARAGRVRWGAGIAFGVAGVVTSFAGSWVNRMIDANALLLAFAGLLLLAATGMLRRLRGESGAVPHRDPLPEPAGGTGVAPDCRPGPVRGVAVRPRTAAPRIAGRPPVASRSALVRMAVAGLAVGFLTGLFGVGGGFVIVPALTLALGYTMPEAVGTSLLVIAINSAAALAARAGHESFQWGVIVPFTAAAIAGSLLGKRISDRISGDTLTRAFAVLLVLLAAYVAVRSISGLAS
ncbi:MAG: sulfite exporter TauE/SafE family protein [Jatrophihabitans sp.]|nr:MAG: sulfite exporter TauE/SafE family protein [Jatrophihabitans sp.]